jgi:hypothetical protein
MAAALFPSYQAKIFFHSGKVEQQIRGKTNGSYWLVCEARAHHGFSYWRIIARLDSLFELEKLNGRGNA